MMNNKAWAFSMMLQGHKVSNQYFTDDEYLHMVNGVITSEDGYNFEDWFNRRTAGDEWKQTGWSLYRE